MLGFSSASFIPRPRPLQDAATEPRKPQQRKEATSRRFLVQRQGYLRNSRRILEIGAHSVLVLDLGLTMRTRLELADVMAVKVGNDENIFTLHMRKGSETFVCLHRAELLGTLLPIIQGDIGGLIFSMVKWSKRMIAGLASQDSRVPVRFRLWSGKLAVIQEDSSVCSSDIPMHTIARIMPMSDDKTGLVLILKHARAGTSGGRVLRFSVSDVENRGNAHFSARDRLVRALADSALAQLGLTLPVEETTEAQCRDMFNASNMVPLDFIESFEVCRVSDKAKPRLLDLAASGLVERDRDNVQLVHHAIAWANLSHVVRLPATSTRASLDTADALPGAASACSSAHAGEDKDCCLCNVAAACGTGGGEQDHLGADAPTEASDGRARVAVCCWNGRVHVYECEERDVLLALLVDTACAHGLWLPVCSEVIGNGWRMGGIAAEGDKEYEDALVERLSLMQAGKDHDEALWVDMAHECFYNLSPAAVARVWSRKPLVNLVQVIHQHTAAQGDAAETRVLVPLLMVGIRLLQARAVFEEVPQLKKEVGASTWRSLEALVRSPSELLSYSAASLLRALLQFQAGGGGRGVGEGAAGTLASKATLRSGAGMERVESANRQALFEGELAQVLLERACGVAVRMRVGAHLQLGAVAALDILDTVALSQAASSGGGELDLVNRVLARLRERVPEVAALFRHASAPLVKRASLLVLGLVQDAEDGERLRLQDSIRAQCALLPQLRLACQPPVAHTHSLVPAGAAEGCGASTSSSGAACHGDLSATADAGSGNSNGFSCSSNAAGAAVGAGVSQPVLSGQLVELLVEGNARSMDLLVRLLPASLLAALAVPWQESATATLQLRGRREAPRRNVQNWPLFISRLRAESHTAEVIWNNETRAELCAALLAEEEAFALAEALHGRDKVTWNDEDFTVSYARLDTEVRVGAYYLRFVLSSEFDVESLGQASTRFLGQLYHAFLTAEELDVQVGCLHAMTKVYRRWNKQPFDALTLSSLVRTLGREHCDSSVRDALLRFLETAIRNSGNARQLVVASDCVPTLINLLTRCHPLRAMSREGAHQGVVMSMRSAALLRMLAERLPHVSGLAGAEHKLLRPMPRAKRMLTDSHTFAKVAQMLLYPSFELVATVMHLIEVVLSKNDPSTVRAAFGSGLLYLLLLGLKHIMEDDVEGLPDSVLCDLADSLSGTVLGAGAAEAVVDRGRGARGTEVGKEQQQQQTLKGSSSSQSLTRAAEEGAGREEMGGVMSRHDKIVALLGRVFGLLYPLEEVEIDGTDKNVLAQERRALISDCREMLEDLLPYPLIIVLQRQGPQALARTLAADVVEPTVVWTRSMREALWEHLHLHLDGFEMELSVSPDAIWQFARAAPVSYKEHEDGDWLGGPHFGYYISVLAQQVREHGAAAVSAVEQADVSHFLVLLLDRLRIESRVGKQAAILSILDALLHNSSTSAHLPASAASTTGSHGVGADAANAKWLDMQLLVKLLHQHAPAGVTAVGASNDQPARAYACEQVAGDQDRLAVLLHAIRVSVGGRITAAAAAEAATVAREAIQQGVPDTVEGILRWSISGLFYLPDDAALSDGSANHPLLPLVPLTLACLRYCEEVARSSEGLVRLETKSELVEILIVCLQCDNLAIIEAATSCVGRLCASPVVHARLVHGHLHLLLLRQLLRDVHCMMEGCGAPDSRNHPHAVRRRSLATVQALGQFVDKMEQVTRAHSNIGADLTALLTRPMLERLEAPDEFLGLFAGETYNPEIVWGAVNRSELAEVIKAGFHNLHVTSPKTPGGGSSAPLWGQGLLARGGASVTGGDAASQLTILPVQGFCFSNVRGLTRVGGIYVEVFNSDPSWEVEDPPSLLGKLFDAIAHGVDGRPASMRQRKEALQAALNLALAQHPSLPRSSVLISPTRIVLLIDLIRSPVPEPDEDNGRPTGDRKHLFPGSGGEGQQEGVEAEMDTETQDAFKSQVLALQLMALGSRMQRTSQVLVEQGLPTLLADLLEGHVDRFLTAIEHEGSSRSGQARTRLRKRDSINFPLYDPWTPMGLGRVESNLLANDIRTQRRLDTQVAIIEVMGCVAAHSKVQLSRFSHGVVLPSLILYLISHNAPLALRSTSAVAISAMLGSPHADPAAEIVGDVLPPFLVDALRSCGSTAHSGVSRDLYADLEAIVGAREDVGEGNAGNETSAAMNGEEEDEEWRRLNPRVKALLLMLDHDVSNVRQEWTSELRAEVILALARSVRCGAYKEGTMPYLERMGQVSVDGFNLQRLNAMVADGEGMDVYVKGEEAPRLFTACVQALVCGGDKGAVGTSLQREIVCTLGEFARSGLISRAMWAQNAESLMDSLLSLMHVSVQKGSSGHRGNQASEALGDGEGKDVSRAEDEEVCTWLHRLLRVATPAVSCQAAAYLVAKPSLARILVATAMLGSRSSGALGPEVLAGSLHVLGCAFILCIRTEHDFVHLILNDGQMLSQLRDLAEQGLQMLVHPTEGEAVRLAIPERQFWAKIEQVAEGEREAVGAGGKDGGGGGKEGAIRSVLPSLKWSMLTEASEQGNSSPDPQLSCHNLSSSPERRLPLMVPTTLKWNMLPDAFDSGSPSHPGVAE